MTAMLSPSFLAMRLYSRFGRCKMGDVINLNLYYVRPMKNKKPFELPKAIINMLEECTKGFYLVTVNDQNEFKTFVYYPDELTEVGILNYVDLQSTAVQEVLREQAVDTALDHLRGDEDEEGEEPSE